jgi:hypothetical protein
MNPISGKLETKSKILNHKMSATEVRVSQFHCNSWPLSNWMADNTHGLDNLDGIPLPSKPSSGLLQTNTPSDNWTIFSPGEDWQHIVLKLLQDSWAVFKHIRLETWVERVIGLPAASLSILETFHDRLAFSLFTHLRQYPHELEKYHKVAQAS